MLQSLDDINIDENFLNDVFDVPSTNISTESNKRNSDPLNDQPVKKMCTTSDNNTKNILSIIKPKPLSEQTKTSETFISNNKPLTNRNNLVNYSINQEKSRRVVQRKFPGPAGILPEQKQLSINIKTLEEVDTSANNKTLESDEIVCSQLTDDIFNKETWLKMLSDWSTISNRISLPNKYTISWTKTKAIAKKLIRQKAPFLAAVIQTVDCSSKDPMILLKDKTGDILATLLHEVWEKYCDYLNPGSVIVLKQVGVLSTLKRHYLAITLNNIVTIYSEQENEETGNTVDTIKIQELSVEELIKTIHSTKQCSEAHKMIQQLQPSTINPYFKKPSNVQQKSPEIQPINRNEIRNNSISTHNEASNTPNKFNFKAKINETNKENKQANVSTISADVTTNSRTTDEEHVILTQVLDGLDTNSLFEEF